MVLPLCRDTKTHNRKELKRKVDSDDNSQIQNISRGTYPERKSRLGVCFPWFEAPEDLLVHLRDEDELIWWGITPSLWALPRMMKGSENPDPLLILTHDDLGIFCLTGMWNELSITQVVELLCVYCCLDLIKPRREEGTRNLIPMINQTYVWRVCEKYDRERKGSAFSLLEREALNPKFLSIGIYDLLLVYPLQQQQIQNAVRQSIHKGAWLWWSFPGDLVSLIKPPHPMVLEYHLCYPFSSCKMDHHLFEMEVLYSFWNLLCTSLKSVFHSR